jgi:dihydrolipoamide dehydrogenase
VLSAPGRRDGVKRSTPGADPAGAGRPEEDEVSDRFDLVVIGAGPGGYVAAIRAAQLDLRVAVVEEDRPGGVCLNWGCIPSKALLTGAELAENLARHGETFGIQASGLSFDYGRAIDHSRKTADRLCKGVQGLLRKNRIELVEGRGRLAGPTSVAVTASGGERLLEAGHVILATGSAEWVPPGLEVDGKRVLTSREALESKDVPERLVVIGAGAVGVEFAYVYAMYGAKVTVVEMAGQMLPGADPDVAAALQREFRRKGIEVRLGTRFEALQHTAHGVTVHVSEGDASGEIEAEQVLAAIGRRPLSRDLGLEDVGVGVTEGGFVEVDAGLRSSVPSVSAIGDLAGAPLLAHKASEEGIAAVELIAGLSRPPLHPERIPSCIYAQPQVAWIGRTEAEAREEWGDELRVGTFPFTASGKAIAAAHTAGFVKILAEPRFGQIVGAHVVGQGATELIAEIGLGMTLEATTTEVGGTVHAHPTLSEAILEAALAAEGRAINF